MPSPASSRCASARNDAIAADDDMLYVSYKTPPRTTGVYGQRVYANGRRSSSFDVAIDGALETPRSFKGYTLGAWARNNTAISSPVSLTGSPARVSPAARHSNKCDCLESRLYRAEHARRERQEAARLAAQAAAEEAENARRVGTTSVEEDGHHLCCPLIGPVYPLVGRLSLLQVGWSPVLHRNAFLMWRVFTLLLAAATVAACVALSWGSRSWFRIFAPAFALLAEARRLSLVVTCRNRAEKKAAVRATHTIYGVDGLAYQCTVTLLVYTTVAAMLAYVSTTFVYLTTGPPRFDAALVLLMILTASYLMDVWVSPIPFRILYVLFAVLINEVFNAAAVIISGKRFHSRIVFILVAAITMMLAYALHLYARAVYLWVHRDRVVAEQKITPVSGTEAV